MHPARRTVSEEVTQRANRREWDGYADEYQAAHGEFLRDVGFLWCPEGVEEADARVLGDVAGRDVLEVGCGAAQCARWLVTQGARPSASTSRSGSCSTHGASTTAPGCGCRWWRARRPRCPSPTRRSTWCSRRSGRCSSCRTPAAPSREMTRVLRPGGTLAFSVTHPVRWTMPDDPTSAGLVVTSSYWDRTPYVEEDDDGRVDLRRAPPHARRLGRPARRRRASADPPAGAGVAGGPRPGLGRLGPRARPAGPGHRDPQCRAGRRRGGTGLPARPRRSVRAAGDAARRRRRRHRAARGRPARGPGCGRPRRRRP